MKVLNNDKFNTTKLKEKANFPITSVSNLYNIFIKY